MPSHAKKVEAKRFSRNPKNRTKPPKAGKKPRATKAKKPKKPNPMVIVSRKEGKKLQTVGGTVYVRYPQREIPQKEYEVLRASKIDPARPYLDYSVAYGDLLHRILPSLKEELQNNVSLDDDAFIAKVYATLPQLPEEHLHFLTENGNLYPETQASLINNHRQLWTALRQFSPCKHVWVEEQFNDVCFINQYNRADCVSLSEGDLLFGDGYLFVLLEMKSGTGESGKPKIGKIVKKLAGAQRWLAQNGFPPNVISLFWLTTPADRFKQATLQRFGATQEQQNTWWLHHHGIDLNFILTSHIFSQDA